MSEYEEGVVDEVQDGTEEYQQYEESPTSEDGYDYEEPDEDSEEPESRYASSEDFKALREQNEELKRNVELLAHTARMAQQPQQQPQQPEYDPEDLPTYGDVEKMIQQRTGSVEAASKKQVHMMQVQQASASLPEYDKVLELANQVVGNNKQLEDMIWASDNPALAAYNLGKTHPDYLKVTQKQVRTDVAGKVKNNLGKPNTLNQAGGGKPKTVRSINDLSKEEFEKEVRRVKALGYR